MTNRIIANNESRGFVSRIQYTYAKYTISASAQIPFTTPIQSHCLLNLIIYAIFLNSTKFYATHIQFKDGKLYEVCFELPIILKLFQNRVKFDFRIVNFVIEESPLEQDRTAFGYSFKH